MRLNLTPKTPMQLHAENDALRQQIAFLEAQMQLLRQGEANTDQSPTLTTSTPYSWELSPE
ncbi:hypothetical protein [Paracoccus laeviglucosivorans]|uniref:Uncharacterized protein n=1 Tax=Paracoccus laeviglucosivorans TaxID=1197861 RepID=A0A521FVI3_9RHOB|nr:hypothetical protein [Paracoccus laeviglucosivorans]SMP00152.1 hypothetical protein SAMN06265221_1653 [Paracoccus laeviglucosivorans]